MTPHWSEILSNLGCCQEALAWAEKQPDKKTAWLSCHRADWMLWIAAKLLPRKLVVKAACDCAETALQFIKDPDILMITLLCLHITREWTEDREDLETVKAARYAAAYAADAVAAYAVAAYAVTAYADAAAYAAAYAADARAADAREKHHIVMCDIIRKRISINDFPS